MKKLKKMFFNYVLGRKSRTQYKYTRSYNVYGSDEFKEF